MTAPTPVEPAQEQAHLRDLGFRPYVGARLAPSHNGWVLFRYGLVRAWANLLVKLAIVGCVAPALLALAVFAVLGMLSAQNPGMPPPQVGDYTRRLLGVETWIFALAIALAGSALISEDRARRAFAFYFAKPVTAAQYLLGRFGALALLIAFVELIPALSFAAGAFALRKAGLSIADLWLVFGIIVHALFAASLLSSVSLAASALAPSRALAAFLLLVSWLVPWLGASLVSAIGSMPRVASWSLPGLLAALRERMFSTPSEVSNQDALLAVGLLVALSSGALWLTQRRLIQAAEIA